MTTLVTPREVIDLAFADGGYLPPEAIGTVDIAAAEARYLLPVTGPALWQKLAEGEYPTLREEFAAPAAACAVRVAMQPRARSARRSGRYDRRQILRLPAGRTRAARRIAPGPAESALGAVARPLGSPRRTPVRLPGIRSRKERPAPGADRGRPRPEAIANPTPAAARRSPPPRTATPAESGIPAKQGAVFCFPGINAYLWPRKRLGGPPVERRTE